MVATRSKQKSKPSRKAVSKNARPRKTAQTGVIRADEVLTIDAFCARMVCKLSSVAEMRRRGLIVRQDGANRLRIHGQDYLNYVASLPPAPNWSSKEEGEASATK